MWNRAGRLFLACALVCVAAGCEGKSSVRSSIVEGRTAAVDAPEGRVAPAVAAETPGEEKEASPPRSDRHAEPFVATPPSGQEVAAGVVVMLHGYNSNHLDFKDVAMLAADSGLIAISVPAPNVSAPMRFQWDKDDVEGTHAYVQEILHEAMRGVDVELKKPEKIWLMGFSQGGMYAAVLSERYHEEYAGALAIAPAGWASIPEECERGKEGQGVWVVTGRKERPEYAAKTQALVEHLKACDLLEEVAEHEGGHQFPPQWRAQFGRLFVEWAKR